MDQLTSGLGQNWWDTFKGAVEGGVQSALTPVVTKAVQQASPSIQQSTKTGVKEWLSEHSGMIIVGVLALVAIIIGIIVIARKK